MKIPKLPSKLTEIFSAAEDSFRFSGKEIKIWVIITAITAVAAVIITVIVTGVSGRDRRTAGAEDAGYNITEIIKETSPKTIFTSDFMLYEDSMEEIFTGLIYSREPMERWSEEFAE